jgi:hypothetical protein
MLVSFMEGNEMNEKLAERYGENSTIEEMSKKAKIEEACERWGVQLTSEQLNEAYKHLFEGKGYGPSRSGPSRVTRTKEPGRSTFDLCVKYWLNENDLFLIGDDALPMCERPKRMKIKCANIFPEDLPQIKPEPFLGTRLGYGFYILGDQDKP